jgi:hypothetical protein
VAAFYRALLAEKLLAPTMLQAMRCRRYQQQDREASEPSARQQQLTIAAR